MSTITLHPFPRVDKNQVAWKPWMVMLNDEQSDLMDIADDWDPNSSLTISAGVAISNLNRHDLRAPVESKPLLKLTAACQETATTFASEASLESFPGGRYIGSVDVDIDTRRIEGQLVVQAYVLLPVVDNSGQTVPWLMNRIIAESQQLKIGLSADNRGFPTSAVSFKDAGWYPAPWRFDLECTDLADTFNNSIRLYLNQDDKAIVDLIKGKNPSNIREQLVASIHRVLLLTVDRLSNTFGTDRTPDEIADEYPESIAAAARRSAVEHLNLEGLSEALDLIRENPEVLEYLILAKL